MNDTKENPVINFRSKFKKVIAEENMEIAMKVFSDYCKSTSAEEAEELLWTLTWIDGSKIPESEEETIARKKELLENQGLDLSIIPLGNVKVFISELRYQYEQTHPSCFSLDVDKEFVDEKLKKLVARTNVIVGNIVFKRCLKRVKYATGLGKVIYLLSSQVEEKYEKGLKEAGFTIDEAEYLKPFHIEVRELIESIDKWNQKVNESVKLNASKKPQTTYFPDECDSYAQCENENCEKHSEDTVTVIEKPTEDTAEVTLDEEPTKATLDEKTTEVKAYKRLTYEDVLNNKELFDAVLKSEAFEKIKTIQKMGFDLNEVFKKAQEIGILIDVASAL